MSQRKRPLPKTLEAARLELDRLERRMRADKQRVEDVTSAMGGLHSQHRLPVAGSRWVRSMNLGLRNRKPLQTAYEFVAYAHSDTPGGPFLVFLGQFDSGPQHTAVSLRTFYREFDPVPATAKRKRA